LPSIITSASYAVRPFQVVFSISWILGERGLHGGGDLFHVDLLFVALVVVVAVLAPHFVVGATGQRECRRRGEQERDP
jgi:hypothetical protein